MKRTAAFESHSFSVGLSFAGEQRDYVEAVALGLKARGVDVFYDAFHEVELWGCNLVDTLDDLYSERMNAVVLFISKEYVAKPYTDVERQAALAKAIQTRQKYIYPVRFDAVKLPGLPSTISYLEASRNTPEQLAAKICQVIGATVALKDNAIAPPSSPAAHGTITFSQVDYDGRAVIGRDVWRFELDTSAAGSDAFHLYNEPASIKGVAIAHGAAEISDVSDARSCDFSSRARTLRKGQVAVLKNKDGFFAALKVVEVQDRAHGAPADSLKLEYSILSEGGVDFSKETA